MTADRRDEERAALGAQIATAARIVSPTWPLERFVAVNPLWGLVDQPFEQAVGVARSALGIRGVPPVDELRRAIADGRASRDDVVRAARRAHPAMDTSAAERRADQILHAADEPPARAAATAGERCDARFGTAVAPAADEETARWSAAFSGAGQWPMPGHEDGFYAAWRAVAGRGPALRRLARPGVRERVAALPARAEDAILTQLRALRVPAARRVEVLRGHLTRLPGWAGHARWVDETGARGLDLASLLAVRLTYEVELLAAAAPGLGHAGLAALLDALEDGDAGTAPSPAPEAGLIALDVLERAYADRLLAELERPPAPAPAARPAAQAVFCIDARSEGLRRRLEEQGPFETLGFAGFFAVAMRFRALGERREQDQAPVLLDPRHLVAEVAPGEQAGRYLAGRRALAGAEHGLHAAKAAAPSPFALAELGGWLAGPLTAARTLAAPTHARLRRRGARAAAPPPAAELDLDGAFTPAEQELIAHTALTMMGLTAGFARLVLLCGHGATTENNPFAAALDCGACGGHEGGPNARAAAAILNAPAVRQALAGRGLVIPDDTWFVAARHDTTTDAVAILDRQLVPDSHAADLERLESALQTAGALHAADRARALPGGPSPAHRAADWAQVRPEWGLARNAAFIAGPRTLTAGLDLGCRAFLHSYDPATDPDATALETILTAPLVVAHWINAQYFFSTTDPEVLGAGDKVVHNVVGELGVVAGPGGDLRVGLPLQACFADGRPYHEPLRLLCVVQAPLERLDMLVARNAVLRHLFGGGWVRLAAREAPGRPWLLRRRDGGWEPWAPAASPVTEAVA